ncbi:TIGR01841 family phasin [Ralstonia pseudosolanacearum]|uniref:Phasin family protein n=1 Tax=Ralstonia solanacearum TaxID=305 RepID=A0AA92EHR6_RALSL|nr:TIGR01841 family phasin [Ralstonia pseudosolanacearum]QCX51456.1 phasin family protein [Ralstonia pseudosolanacearum]
MSASNQNSNTVQAANLDAVFGLTTKTLDACRKLSDLGAQAMKESIANYQETMHRALTANGAQALFALQANALEPAAERVWRYLQQAQEIAAGTRADFQKMAEIQYESNMRNMQQAFDSLSQNAPAGSESALTAWQSAVTSTAALCKSMHQATRHAIEFTENRVIEAAAAASAATRKANAQVVANR